MLTNRDIIEMTCQIAEAQASSGKFVMIVGNMAYTKINWELMVKQSLKRSIKSSAKVLSCSHL